MLEDKRVCLIVNPKAGFSRRNIAWHPIEEIVDFFADKKIATTMKITTAVGEGEMLAKEAVEEGFKFIVACGGDGTINEVINGLADSDAVMGAIPMGTENILCKAMEIPLNIKPACQHFLDAEVQKIDYGKANERIFIVMAGVGLDADVIKNMDPEMKNMLGTVSFVLKGVYSLIAGQDYKAKVKIELLDKGETHEMDAWMVLVGNLPYYGGKIKVALEAEIDDGLLDIIAFLDKPDSSVVNQLIEVFTEKHNKVEDVMYFKSSDFKITTDHPVNTQIDGEYLGKTPLHCKAVKRGLRIKM